MRPLPALRALPALPALLALSLVVASSAAAQPSWRSHLDPSRLKAGSDSFAFMIDGQPRGWQKLSASRDGDAWVLSDEVQMGAFVQQRSDVRFSAGFVEQSLRQSGSARGKAMQIELDRAGQRLTGTARTPTGGDADVPIDVEASDDVIDDNAVAPILPFIKWAEGLSFSIPVLKSGKGTIAPNAVMVRGKGSVTVGAGTFEAWQVVVSEGDRPWLEAHVTTTAPYRVVRMGPPGGRMVVELVK
jgi:hypothetical protein